MQRRELIVGGIIVFVLFIAALILIPTIFKAPSCTDQKQNADEEGIDCGGTSCTYLCTNLVEEPKVLFVRPVSPFPGRTDVVAYVDNVNPNIAAKNAAFTVEIRDENNQVIATKTGAVDLPPSATVPIYVSGLFSGNANVARAFIEFDASSFHWYRYTDERIIPKVRDISPVQGSAPRVTAFIDNPSADVLTNVKLIVTVFDTTKNTVLGASQTVVGSIPPQGTAQAVFTWDTPFAGEPGAIEVKPVVPLPRP